MPLHLWGNSSASIILTSHAGLCRADLPRNQGGQIGPNIFCGLLLKLHQLSETNDRPTIAGVVPLPLNQKAGEVFRRKHAIRDR